MIWGWVHVHFGWKGQGIRLRMSKEVVCFSTWLMAAQLSFVFSLDWAKSVCKLHDQPPASERNYKICCLLSREASINSLNKMTNGEPNNFLEQLGKFAESCNNANVGDCKNSCLNEENFRAGFMRVDDKPIVKEALLWIMDSYFSEKW